jgi:hypothetical protein
MRRPAFQWTGLGPNTYIRHHALHPSPSAALDDLPLRLRIHHGSRTGRGSVQEAVYDANGTLVGRAYEGAALPLNAIRALGAIAPDGKVEEVEAITTGGVLQYEVEVTSGGKREEVLIDANGTILSRELEEEEAEEDEAAAAEPMIQA